MKILLEFCLSRTALPQVTVLCRQRFQTWLRSPHVCCRVIISSDCVGVVNISIERLISLDHFQVENGGVSGFIPLRSGFTFQSTSEHYGLTGDIQHTCML